jgi:hypothetical protein
MQSKEFEEEK